MYNVKNVALFDVLSIIKAKETVATWPKYSPD